MSKNKRPIRLGKEAIRSLINEAIQGRQPGDPLFTPPSTKHSVRESADSRRIHELINDFADQLSSYWMREYYKIDSLQDDYSEEEFHAVVERAVDDVIFALSENMNDAEEKLHSGDYKNV